MHAIVHEFDSLETDFCQANFDDEYSLRPATDEETAKFLLDDGPVLKTNWTVYDRQFSDGQRELCVTKSVLIRQTSPLAMPNRARRGESEKRDDNATDSAKRAKQAVRLRCKAIGADRMITLTYRENMQDKERLKKDWDAFRRRMGKVKQFHYVATVETQERGALHIHCAVRGRQAYQVVRSIWQRIVGLDEFGRQAGQINVRDPHKFGFGKNGQHKLAAYISKYISKDVDAHVLNKKHYWSSKGIVIPEKNYYSLPYGTSDVEAFTHVLALAAAHNNDGMVFFGNQALGVCWVATPPTLH